MKSSALRKGGQIFLSLAMVGLIGFETLVVAGFCFKRSKFLSTSEFVEEAVRHQAQRINGVPDNPNIAAIRSYIANHPGCCSVDRGDSPFASSFIDRILGFSNTVVKLKYALRDDIVAKYPRDGSYYEAYVTISPCGAAIKSSGIRSTHL
jgi:hypothetical protein